MTGPATGPTADQAPPPPSRAALVTGAGRRIGRAIALKLAAAGWDVAIHCGHGVDEAETVARAAETFGVRAAVIPADLTDEAALLSIIDQGVSRIGVLSLLINNASTFEDDRFGTLDRGRWDDHFSVNLRAPIMLAERFAQQAPDGGTIINLLDQRVLKPNPLFFSYALSKSALWTATQMMAQALAPRLRVNAVAPGPVLPSTHQDRAAFDREAAGTLLGHPSSPEEIAEAVLFLVNAPSVTGQLIAVDGGQHLGWQTPDLAAG